MTLDLEEELEIAERATPGPWVKDYGGSLGHIKRVPVDRAITGHRTPTVIRYDVETLSMAYEEKQDNGEFIARAREGYPAALRQLIAIRDLCQSMNHAGVNTSDHALAGRVITIIEQGE